MFQSQLISLVGNVRGHLYPELSDSALEEKSALCCEFASALDHVDGGASDWSAATLFEGTMAEAMLAQKKLAATALSTDLFRAEMKRLSSLLQLEVAPALEVEAEGTHANGMAKRAKKAAEQMDELAQFADFL